jgi:tyrosine-protein kinase Etk/Wzc
MIQQTDNSAFYPEPQNNFDFKKFIYHLARKWHWFVISVFIGLSIARLYDRYMPPTYNIQSSLTVNQYESGMKQLNLSQITPFDRKIDILGQDHASRIKSFIMNFNTLQSLGWNISWYQKTPFYDKDLYGNEPFKVILLPNKSNVKGIPIFIKTISDSEYLIEVEPSEDGLTIPVKQTKKGRFGKPFESQYFGFILEKDSGQSVSGKELYFVINDLNKLAMKYQNKIQVISNEKKPDIIKLIVSESNLKRGVDYLNRLEQTYIDYGLMEKNRVAENTMNFIDSQLKRVTDSMSQSERKFTSFRTQTQSVDLNQEGGIAIQKRETLESEKAVLENRIKYLRNLLDEMNDSRQMKQVVVPMVFGITDQTLNNLVLKLSDLYSKREILSFSVQDKAPSLILLDKEIQLTHNVLAQNITSLLSTTESDLENLIHRSGGFNSQLTLLPKTEQQFSSFKRSFDLDNELYTYLRKMHAESAITYASNQPDVRVLDSARPETSLQTGPNTKINYLIGIIFGLIVPYLIISLNDFIKGNIHSKEEVEDLLKLPILGMVTHNKSKKDLVVLDNPRSNISESFRLIRTNLKFMLNGCDKKVIALQSTISGEGKSFISINLASILAKNNFKILLVGLDMRKSKLDKVLNSNVKKGISTYLSNQDSFEDIVEDTPIPNLSYIPSGPVPPNPAELLENGSFDRFLKEAKSRFDYIVLDNAPVALVTDGIIAGRYADINLFVIRFRYSKREQIKLIKEFETTKTLPKVALVLNDAISENFAGGGYYNYRKSAYYSG